MKYLIKSLKWTKNDGIETWYKSNCNGYTTSIFYAGIYSEEDKLKMQDVIAQKVIQFIPISDKIKNRGIKQLQQYIKQYEMDIERANSTIQDSRDQIKIINGQIDWFIKTFNT